MDDITKKMCKQLHEGYYGSFKRPLYEADGQTPPEEAPEEAESSDTKRFPPEDKVTLTFITALENYVKTGLTTPPPLNYNDLIYNKQMNRVTWSGLIGDDIKWEVIEMKGKKTSERGVYIDIIHGKINTAASLALHKLNVYLSEVWINEIEKAINNKTFDQAK
jgi:hypothetical protein